MPEGEKATARKARNSGKAPKPAPSPKKRPRGETAGTAKEVTREGAVKPALMQEGDGPLQVLDDSLDELCPGMKVEVFAGDQALTTIDAYHQCSDKVRIRRL